MAPLAGQGVRPAHGPEPAARPQHLPDVLGARCAAELSRFKRPEAIYVVEDLPRAATGTIQRYRLRQPDPVPASAPAY